MRLARSFGLVVLIGSVVFTGAKAQDLEIPPPAPAPTPTHTDESYEATHMLTRIVELVREQYVDESKVSYEELYQSAAKGVLSSLDPHSQFLDEDAFAAMQKDTSGEFSGLGLMVGSKDGAIVVLSSMEGTPSHRAGILPGDRILKIDGVSTEEMSLNQAVKQMKGDKGESIRLTLLRRNEEGEGTVVEPVMQRETIRVATVREAKILPEEITGKTRIGYVRLEQFGEHTEEEFADALAKLEAEGMEALVLDLRNNPGGLLDAAVEVAGKFLPPGQVVVSTKGRQARNSYEYRAASTQRAGDYPLAVLVNSYSASGAEIVAGALQDLDRAVLIGETTFGKGSVQSVQSLGNGIGLRLTTAHYYTPSKKVIHEVGVAPDIAVPISREEEEQLQLATRPHLLDDEQKKQLRNLRDTQLERAVIALKGVNLWTARQQSRQARNEVQRQAANKSVPAPAVKQ